MISHNVVAYERYDTKSVVVPAHSACYHLTPIGIGTAFVEHLSNYAVRLATAHCIYPGDFFRQMLWPQYKSPANTAARTLTAQLRSVNGISSSSNAWIQLLERLTLQTNLCFLTLRTWSPVLDPQRLLRSNRAWCPTCYEEQRKSGEIIYDQLLWTLAVVTICPRHQQRLHLECPNPQCRKAMPVIALRMQPGYCCYCGGWLGAPVDESLSTDLAHSVACEDIFKWEQWVAGAVGELLAIAPTLRTPPLREQISQIITTRSKQGGQFNLAALARQIKLDHGELWQLQQGRSKPSLATLLALCYKLDIAPVRLLTSTPVLTQSLETTQPGDVGVINRPKRPRRKFDTELVHQALEAALAHDSFPPIYATDIARQLGYSAAQVQAKFPNEWAALVEKSRNAERVERARRRALCNTETVRRQLEAVLASDENPPPTMREVASRLGFSRETLHLYFPELCRAITVMRRKPFNIAQLREHLETVLNANENPSPSIHEVAQRLGYTNSTTLWKHFPELCHAISARFESRIDLDGIRAKLEAILVSNEMPAPNMQIVARRLGFDSLWLLRHFPTLCRDISAAAGRRKFANPIAIQQALENALARGALPRLTVSEVARNFGYDASLLRECFPELCRQISARNKQDLAYLAQQLAQKMKNVDEGPQSVTAIVKQLGITRSFLKKYFPEQRRLLAERYQNYLRERGIQRKQMICAAIRQATLDLHAQGLYPNKFKVMTLLNMPYCLRDPEAILAWRDTLKALGYT